MIQFLNLLSDFLDQCILLRLVVLHQDIPVLFVYLHVHGIWIRNESVFCLREFGGEVMAGRAAYARNHRPEKSFRLVLVPGPNPLA